MSSICHDGSSLQRAVDLALIVTRDDWAMAVLDIADGRGEQSWISTIDAKVRDAFHLLSSRTGTVDGDWPDLAAASARGDIPAALTSCGMGSARIVRRRLPLAEGQYASCVLATVRAMARTDDPECVRGIGLLADQIIECSVVRANDAANTPTDLLYVRHLEAAQALARVGSWSYDPKTGRCSGSPELWRILGTSVALQDDVLHAFLSRVPDEDRELAERAFAASMNGTAREFDHRIRTDDGAFRWIRQRGAAVVGSGDRRTFTGTIQDITDFRDAEDRQVRLRLIAEQAQQQFRTLFESAPGLFLVLTPDCFRIVAVSNAYLTATMVTREQIMGRTMFDVFPDDPADVDATGVAALSASLERVRRDCVSDVMAVQRYPIRRPESEGGGFELRYWSPINSPVVNPDGSIAFIIHRVEDVTEYVLSRQPDGANLPQRQTARLEAEIVVRSLELKQLADSLAQSELRFRYVTQATNDVVWDWTLADDALWCSHSALEPIGSALAGCICLSDWEAYIHLEDRRRVVDSLRAAVERREEKWAVEYRLCLGNDERCVLHRSFLVIDPQRQPQRMVGSITDLTEQKKQEVRLRMQAELLDYATDAILVRDLDNHVLYWNQAAVERYGWNSDQVIGRHVAETLYATCPPQDFENAMQFLLSHGDFSGRMLHTTADGRIIVVHAHWILVRNEDGTPRAIMSVVTDLSERLALEQRLLQIQKLESLGRLTGGIAHDFNNWLTVIIGNAEELVEELADQPELSEVAHMILMAGERGAQLTRRLLAFARRQPLSPQTLQVGEVIESLRPLIARSLPESIELRLLDTDRDWCVLADRGQLEAAVLNLSINARDAMPAGGKLTIQLFLAEVDTRSDELNSGLMAGEYVVIAVSDNGHGISPEAIDHVFEPFFTTKDEASGSGLGLSMVYGFVKQSNGDVTIYSESGRGALVKVYLPRVHLESQQPAVGALRKVSELPDGCAILLVEDDPIVREHILAQLRDLGCNVEAASDAAEALALLAQDRQFDILFSDVVMPGMSGIELIGHARALRPGLRILLSSGYTFEALQYWEQLGPDIRVLNKPYGRALLAQTLAEVLDSAREKS